VNPRLSGLHPYPFEKQRLLLQGLEAPKGTKPINLGIGEPQHPTPEVVTRALIENLGLLGKYPASAGMPELRGAIADWIASRYQIPRPNADREVIPVSGTREALFAFAQAVLNPSERSVVLMPNPFYQIYEGAAIMAGAEPFYVPTPASNGFLPSWDQVPETTWPDVRLAYVCSPGNPCGAVMGLDDWREVFELSDRYGFIVAADECYSEIYNSEPPMGALQAAHLLGRSNERIVVFNSLSKRSSSPGLRSGFVAGDPSILAKFLLYRTYHGAAPSLVVQAASAAAWSDEEHVAESRAKYQAKFDIAREVLGDRAGVIPEGGFFLWIPVDDAEATTRRLFAEFGLTVLPGQYLARETTTGNPGAGYLRVALVPELDVCRDAMERLRTALS